jgi:hypothetical protein
MSKTSVALLGIVIGLLLIYCNKTKEDNAPSSSSVSSGGISLPNPCDFSDLSNFQLTAIYDNQGNELPDSSVNDNTVNWQVPTPRSGPSFSGAGRYGNCSATLIESNSSNSAAPAYVLTAAHCVGSSLLSATTTILNQAEAAGKVMYFNYYQQNVAANNLIAVPATTIAYASMQQTDVAVVQIDSTLAALKEQGICAYKLASSRPTAGNSAINAGVPLSGVLAANYGIHLSRCNIGASVSIREGEYRFVDSFRHNCSIVGGNSGSSLFSADTKEVIGVVNTTTNDSAMGEADCSLDKPCEVDSAGNVSTQSQYNYGQYIDFLAGCFNESGVFDTTLSSCGVR